MNLDPYSKRFADRFFRRYPQWRGYAATSKADPCPWLLYLEIPAANKNAACGMLIETGNNSITVGFDHWHTHFEQIEEQTFELAEVLVADLLAEKIVVVSYFEGNR